MPLNGTNGNPDRKLHSLLPPRSIQHYCLRKQREFTVPSVNTNFIVDSYTFEQVLHFVLSQLLI